MLVTTQNKCPPVAGVACSAGSSTARRPGAGRAERLAERARRNPRQPPPQWAPKYVHACHEDRWKLQLRSKRKGGGGMVVPFRCNSRHHRGPCQDKWRRTLFARLLDPRSQFMACHEANAMFWTLTLPSSWHRDVTAAKRLAANRMLGAYFLGFRKALNKWLVRRGHDPIRYFWIREDHKSGVPHVHLLVVHAGLAAMLHARDVERVRSQAPEDGKHLAPPWLRELAQRHGWGERFDAQLAIDRAKLAQYAAKVCAQMDELVGEVSKGSQVPELLPRGCRSYGCSRGFIPPRNPSSGLWTGWLEDENGRAMRRPVYSPEQVRSPMHREREAAKPWPVNDGPVFDSSNPLARWETSEEAHRYACGLFPGEPVRRYRLASRGPPGQTGEGSKAGPGADP